jgi:hypothetical protein
MVRMQELQVSSAVSGWVGVESAGGAVDVVAPSSVLVVVRLVLVDVVELVVLVEVVVQTTSALRNSATHEFTLTAERTHFLPQSLRSFAS